MNGFRARFEFERRRLGEVGYRNFVIRPPQHLDGAVLLLLGNRAAVRTLLDKCVERGYAESVGDIDTIVGVRTCRHCENGAHQCKKCKSFHNRLHFSVIPSVAAISVIHIRVRNLEPPFQTHPNGLNGRLLIHFHIVGKLSNLGYIFTKI